MHKLYKTDEQFPGGYNEGFNKQRLVCNSFSSIELGIFKGNTKNVVLYFINWEKDLLDSDTTSDTGDVNITWTTAIQC